MKRLAHLSSAAGLVCVGAVIGSWINAPSQLATAQQDVSQPGAVSEPVDISVANAERIKLASDALASAQTALEQDGLYLPVIRGPNAYAVLVGGLNAVEDLESGRGIDPISYAGLHTGLATDEVTPDLGFDANGRLLYKGKLVRIYPVERMKRLNERAAAVLAVTQGGRRPAGGAPQP